MNDKTVYIQVIIRSHRLNQPVTLRVTTSARVQLLS